MWIHVPCPSNSPLSMSSAERKLRCVVIVMLDRSWEWYAYYMNLFYRYMKVTAQHNVFGWPSSALLSLNQASNWESNWQFCKMFRLSNPMGSRHLFIYKAVFRVWVRPVTWPPFWPQITLFDPKWPFCPKLTLFDPFKSFQSFWECPMYQDTLGNVLCPVYTWGKPGGCHDERILL